VKRPAREIARIALTRGISIVLKKLNKGRSMSVNINNLLRQKG
jgi:hypothetical protein